ncbi:MAG TPA: hypothetical protein PKD26_01860 [Pyrinomonadaceae bacterium]|nr:hypothetical protein [Pyrinomonadaceae bacterium]
MSKPKSRIFTALRAVLSFFGLTVLCAGQGIEATLTVDGASRMATVNGKFISDGKVLRNLSFTNAAVAAPNLVSRISNIVLYDAEGEAISFRRFSPGEFAAEGEISSFSYTVALAPLPDPRSDVHVSWSIGSRSLLIIDDLLPHTLAGRSPRATLAVVEGNDATIITTSSRRADGRYDLPDRSKAVFLLNGLHPASFRDLKGQSVDLAISGERHFTDEEATAMANAIVERYANGFGGRPDGKPRVILLQYDRGPLPHGTWEARTIGNTVIVISTDMPFRSQSLQRLHEQLRHELFHLWIPNGVRLDGPYDWFFEGFALYHSLKIGVEMNRITFNDMLDTLSRAYHLEKKEPRRSLIEWSLERWRGNETRVYAHGMLIAFHADVLLLERSGGKASVESLLRDLYLRYRERSAPSAASDVVIKMLSEHATLAALVRDNVLGSEPIRNTSVLEAAGLEFSPDTDRDRLSVRAKTNGRQKAMLDRLGYNSWRKIRK